MEKVRIDNVQVVQDLYGAFGRGDGPAILALLDEDVDWFFNGPREEIPFAGRRRGHKEMIEFFQIIGETCEILEFGPDEILTMSDQVLVLGHERVRVRKTGRVFESEWAHVFKVVDGKVVKLREYYDTTSIAAAFKAA